MTDDVLNKAEKRGYNRGYNAGRRKGQADKRSYREQRNRAAAEQAFWERVFLAALPVAMQVQNWTLGGEKVSTGEQRVELASIWAGQAVARRRKRYG